MALRKAVVTDAPTTDEVTKAATTPAAEVNTSTVQVEQAEQVTAKVDQTTESHTDEAVAGDADYAEIVKEESVKPEVVAEQATQAVAVKQEASAPSKIEQRQGVMQQFQQELAASGFEGMEVTGMSFERVRLHEGTFKIGQEDSDLGKEFKCQILSTRPIFVVRQSSDQDAEMFYSYDPKGLLKTDGTSAEDILADWRADGYGVEGSPLEIKPYREVMATLKGRDDEYDEMVVSLSIPPASVDRIAGVAFTAKQKFRCMPDGVITECKVGKEVGEGSKKFRPWVFKVTQTIEQFEAAMESA